MNIFSESFDKTLDRFNISQKAIAMKVGISPSSISEFRSGKRGISCIQLEKVLLAMDELEPGSRRHFCMLAAGQDPTDLVEQVQFWKPHESAAVMRAIADKLSEHSIPHHHLAGTIA